MTKLADKKKTVTKFQIQNNHHPNGDKMSGSLKKKLLHPIENLRIAKLIIR